MKLSRPKPSHLALTLLLLTPSASLLAADALASHEHGHGTLQLAVSGNQVELLLRSPAYNLLGFEHAASTEAERQIRDRVMTWLTQTPLVNTPDQACEIHTSKSHQDNGKASHNHQDEGEHHDESGAGHSDIEISQTLTCQGLGDDPELGTPLPERFPELEHLDIEWLSAAGQGAIRLEHGQATFHLAH
nr:DUF2796 domain-containing protein [uncultured Marinobacter sp.]